MEKFLIFFGGVILGVLIEHLFFKKNPTNDDQSKEIQAIINKVDLIIEDIKKTI